MKNAKRLIAGLLSVVMVFCAVCVPAFAYEDTNVPTIEAHPEDTMSPVKTVYPIGAASFYKVNGTVVTYSDIDEDGFEHIPSSYIKGSSYNEENKDFGMYVTDDGEVHFVALELCHLNNGNYTWFHGTADAATVSSDVDQATNEDPTMSTQFYINIENGIDPDGTTKEEMFGKGTADPRVSYEITVQTKSTYQLNATIPMYVCMYGYRGTGNIVTPTEEAYRMKNYSTINETTNATIVDIVMLTKYARIYDEDHSNETLVAIAYDKVAKEYRYWYSASQDFATTSNDVLLELAGTEWENNINASGECYVICIDKDGNGTMDWDFKAAGVLDGDTLRETVEKINPAFPLTEDFVYGEWNFGKQFAVGAQAADVNDETEGLAIKVTELQAVPATWRLVPVSTGASALRRGELAMSIAPEKAISNASAIDLALCSAPLDITENGWFLDAPAVVNGAVEVPTELGLKTAAQMAGGNVNDAGCTPVVKVHYTVTPAFGINDGITNTVGSDAIASNK